MPRKPSELTLRIRKMAQIERLKDKLQRTIDKVSELKVKIEELEKEGEDV